MSFEIPETMTAPLLSICIPTFNRGACLRDSLDAIKKSELFNVEIVVSDNASSDDTIAVLEAYSAHMPLRWQRQSENLGFDRNCAAVVSMARGQYCWLLGSDDCVTSDALERIIWHLRQYEPDIFHFGYVQGDIHLHPMYQVAPPKLISPVQMTRVGVAQYLSGLQNISLAFAFISCFIFRRRSWLAQLDRISEWQGSQYIHAYVIHTMLATGATVLSSNECFVIARGGNPNEWNSSPGKLLCLDAVTLTRIHHEIYHGEQFATALGQVFRRSYTLSYLIITAARGGMPHIRRCQPQLLALGIPKLFIRSLNIVDTLGLTPVLGRLISLRRKFLNFLQVR